MLNIRSIKYHDIYNTIMNNNKKSNGKKEILPYVIAGTLGGLGIYYLYHSFKKSDTSNESETDDSSDEKKDISVIQKEQEILIQGIVIETPSNIPIPSANVFLKSMDGKIICSTISDKRGYFVFHIRNPEQHYIIEGRKIPLYEIGIETITVSLKDCNSVTLRLSKAGSGSPSSIRSVYVVPEIIKEGERASVLFCLLKGNYTLESEVMTSPVIYVTATYDYECFDFKTINVMLLPSETEKIYPIKITNQITTDTATVYLTVRKTS